LWLLNQTGLVKIEVQKVRAALEWLKRETDFKNLAVPFRDLLNRRYIFEKSGCSIDLLCKDIGFN
jgi:hypothetical protein